MDFAQLELLEAISRLRQMMEEDEDPNSPRNQHARELQKLWESNGGQMPSLPTFECLPVDAIAGRPRVYDDDRTYLNRDRKNTGARKQQRAAKARRRRK